MTEEEAFKGDEAVPKSAIRKVFQSIMEAPDASPDEKIRAGEALAKLEGYTGPHALNKREEMRIGVMIVQTSKHAIPLPKVSPGLGKRKVGEGSSSGK